MRRENLGLSTFELLIALAVSSPIIVILGVHLHRAVLNHMKVVLAHELSNTTLRIDNLLEEIVSSLDEHRFNLTPRLHKGGEILFADGTPSTIIHSNFPPSPFSDAITSLKIDIKSSQIIKSAHVVNDQASFYVCPRYGKELELSEHSRFIGVNADGLIELIGSGVPHSGANGCFDLELRSEKSMSINGDDTALALVRIIVPVTDHFTLYVDDTNELRFASHYGESLIENQPVVKNVELLKLSSDFHHGYKIFTLHLTLKLLSGTKHRRSFSHQLGREAHFNFLLNRP